MNSLRYYVLMTTITDASTHAFVCCVTHGCNFGDESCPVENGSVKQQKPCPQCIEAVEKFKESFEPHISHCCAIHGCKYGEDDCPVVKKAVVQDYLCESCPDLKEAKRIINALGKSLEDAIDTLHFVKGFDVAKEHQENHEKGRILYQMKNTVRSTRVRDELLKAHENDHREECADCKRFLIAVTPEHPLAGDPAYKTNSINTVSFRSDPFASEIRQDDTEKWLCNECYRNSEQEI